MKATIRHEHQRIKLVIDDPNVPKDEQGVLAAMTLFEGTGCWHLVDVRLSLHKSINRYSGSGSAEDYHSSWEPKSPEEAELVKSLLREYREDSDGTIRWASFDGLVRGHPEVNGYRPVNYADFDQVGYFSYAEGLAYLKEAQTFWNGFEGDPNSVRIDNPHRQPSQSELSMRVFAWRAGIDLPGLEAPIAPPRKKASIPSL